MEIWKPIQDLDNYEVSSVGNVRNVKTGRILKACISSSGYYTVCFHHKGKQFTKSIHRLVGLTFLDNPENKSQIDHINRNKLDNRLENLRWATISENNVNRDILNKLGEKYIYKDHKRYKVYICYKKIYLGAFETLEEAVKARDEYLQKIDSANFPQCE